MRIKDKELDENDVKVYERIQKKVSASFSFTGIQFSKEQLKDTEMIRKLYQKGILNYITNRMILTIFLVDMARKYNEDWHFIELKYFLPAAAEER